MMASVVAGGNRKKSLTLRGVDPETCMIVFKNHWAQVVKILEKHEPSRGGALSFLSANHGSGVNGAIPADEASAVQNYVEHMLFLLMEEEAGKGGAMGAILEFVVLEGVMERLFLWSLRRQFTEDMKLEQLRIYQMLLHQAKQPLLHHKPILRPLMMLLASCAGPNTECGGVVEAELVLLLNQLCTALVKDPSVLELFFHTSEDQGAANFLLFSLLIPYTHRRGLVGQQARDALLLIMSLSASEPRVAQHIAENTYFCPVLATGLSGLYSSLPARLQVYSEDWYRLDQADWEQVPALVQFLNCLDFCGAVTKEAHPSIRLQLLNYISQGFLVPVLAPALHKVSVEEVMTTTAYLDLFLRSVREPWLLHTFLSFVLLHVHDGVHILDTLVSRVNTPFQLGTVSLALFRTLIGLFCEDVMLQLVLRYLIPCFHLKPRRRPLQDSCSSCAPHFLLLMPSWCHPSMHWERVHWPEAKDLSVCDGVAYRRSSDVPVEANYPQYLRDARRAVAAATRACESWSAAYDGVDPPPADRWERGSPALSRPASALSSTGTPAGRASSALELEWDDIFQDEEEEEVTAPSSPTATNKAESLPPRHIQEMRRRATKLVRGSYVEESEFQDDVLVYDLVAQKDSTAAAKPTNRRPRATAEWAEPRCPGDDPNPTPEPTGRRKSQRKPSPENGSSAPSDGFVSQYRRLMLSLGAEPEDDGVIGDVGAFGRRVEELKRKLRDEDVGSGWDSSGEDENEETEEEEEKDATKSGERRNGVPFTGPFISVLLSRLENLLENSISVNLLVTGILVQLASYPQPLLRSFLLNADTNAQPNVRTLYQVLVSVRAQIERHLLDRPDYPALVTEAWRFLLAKDQEAKFRECLQSHDGDAILDPSLPNGSVKNALPLPPLGVLPPCPVIPSHAKSRVFAVVLFAEFLKEMAAVAQEHSVASRRRYDDDSFI